MKVASTKYEVATSIITIFMLENVYMYQIVFTTTIDTMLFSVSFTEILMSYGSSVRSWTPEPGTPTDPTGFGTTTHQEEYMCYLNVFAVLYYMAYDILKQTMYSMY